MAVDMLILLGVVVAVLAAMVLLGRGLPSGFASRFHCLGPTELQDPLSSGLIGDVETTLGEQVPDILSARRESAIEQNGMLDNER